jgi:hypothetical protein
LSLARITARPGDFQAGNIKVGFAGLSGDPDQFGWRERRVGTGERAIRTVIRITAHPTWAEVRA